MKLIVTDHGDPSTGIQPSSFAVESPFVPDDIGEDILGIFKNDIINTYSEYALGRITAMYEFEIEAENERWRSLNNIDPEQLAFEKRSEKIAAFKSELQKLKDNYGFGRQESDNFNGEEELVNTDYYFVVDGEAYYGETISDILNEVFGVH